MPERIDDIINRVEDWLSLERVLATLKKVNGKSIA
jgi:hypothetical protein